MVLGLGPRFVAEAAFLIGVAVAAGVLSLSTPAIVAVMGGAWLVVAAVEFAVSRRGAGRAPEPARETAAAVAPEPPAPQPLVEQEPLPEPVPPEVVIETPPPDPLEPLPEGSPPPLPEPVAPADEPVVGPAKPDEEPEPAERARPALVAVPPPPAPEPEPEPEPQVVPAAAEVVPLRAWGEEPREWNLWDLERAVRERAEPDAERDEERAYLLIYLRDFAGPDGLLPATFDRLVRDSFGDLLGTGAR
jgi:hypothetical protein